ncbi:MAG: GntR family transcriptional repressor for pyruvate dehydrogenase complex [Paraglaciecola sp.]|jgi:GntR family transcriptional repressor for pyruvate dehydrogenase complex
MQQLESMIIDGTYLAGQKLPAERELAEKFSVSRPSIREAIQKLEGKNLVQRKHGGGTFVSSQLYPLVTDPLLALISERPETQFDLLEFRHALEGMAAYYAALRGQPEDYRILQQALECLPHSTESKDKSAEADALVKFYLAMTAAAHNVVLLHVMRSLQELLKDNIQRNLEVLTANSEAQENIAKQRKNIVKAILQRDPEQARHASNEHLAFIEETLLNINRQDMRMQRALRRIEVKK